MHTFQQIISIFEPLTYVLRTQVNISQIFNMNKLLRPSSMEES